MDEQKARLIPEGRPVVVTMPAEIDHGNAGHVGQRLSGALGSGTPVVIADLTATTFCSTAGVQALARANRQATAGGIDLRVVVSPSGHVQRVLAICGLDRVLRCYPSLAAARDDAPARGLLVP
jgi:anti-sigma B factor antagonist